MQVRRPILIFISLTLMTACTGQYSNQSMSAQAAIQIDYTPTPQVSLTESTEASSDIGEIQNKPPATCPVTLPQDPPFKPPLPYLAQIPYEGEFWYGTQDLWTILNVDGTWSQLPHDENGYTQKIYWERQGYDWLTEPQPELTVTGRRLDSKSPPLIATNATNGYQEEVKSFMLVGVEIPSPGCWEITGHYHNHDLSFVVLITP